MKVSIAQTNIIWEDKSKNLDAVYKLVIGAKSANSEIILFPEMSLTGFSMNINATAENDLESVNKVSKIAKDNSIAIGIGWTKRVGEKAENHYTILDSNGQLLSDYTKIHPFSYAKENMYFNGGNEITFFKLGNYKWSTFICYDLRFPEIFQVASEKAEIIIVPANWPKKRENHWRTLLTARAIENQCYILGINCVGNIGNIDYSGCSMVISPEGDILKELKDEEGLIFADINIDVKSIRDQFPVKNDRRNVLYKELIS